MPPTSAQKLVVALAETARSRGGRALLVGGCVRDHILGIEPKDLDVELFGVSEAESQRVLGSVAQHVVRVGRSFPVFKAWDDEMGAGNAVDVALPRREVKTGDRHSDFAVQVDPAMPFAEAAARRDFTINAISMDPLTGELIDPHGGVGDLRNGILRHVSDRFAEDPLRVLRGMQFCGRFGLEADPSTISFCRGLDAGEMFPERIFEEWQKFILKSKVPGKGLGFLEATGWDRHFPEVAALKGVKQDPAWHPEGDADIHTRLCLDAFAKRRVGDPEKDLRVGLAVLCHDFGKATHTQFVDGKWTSHGHAEAGAGPTATFLRRMSDQTALVDGVTVLVTNHMLPGTLHKETKSAGDPASMDHVVRRLALKLGRVGTSIDELCTVVECDKAGRPPLPEHSAGAEWLRSRAEAACVLHEKPKTLLMGRDLIDLGLRPGVGFKPVLEEAFNRQMSGEIKTHEDAVAFAQSWLARGTTDASPRFRPLPTPGGVAQNHEPGT